MPKLDQVPPKDEWIAAAGMHPKAVGQFRLGPDVSSTRFPVLWFRDVSRLTTGKLRVPVEMLCVFREIGLEGDSSGHDDESARPRHFLQSARRVSRQASYIHMDVCFRGDSCTVTDSTSIQLPNLAGFALSH